MISTFWIIYVLTLAVAISAGWLDWRTRRIPNWLTVPAFGTGIAANALVSGWPGAKGALEGAGLALGLLLPFVLARGLGAGDWKLMGALGAFLQPSGLVVVLLGTLLIAAVMAVAEMVRSRRILETLSNLWVLLVAIMTFGIGAQRQNLTLDNPELMALPFGVAAALSTVLFFGALSVSVILNSRPPQMH
jgi:prepilin peptidase CpaA